MNYQEILIGGSIAILYPFFFAKFADVFTQHNHIKKLCDEHRDYSFLPTSGNKSDQKLQEYNQCVENREVLLESSKTTKFIILMIVGVAAIFLSFSGLFTGRASTFGLSLAGFFTLLYAVSMYWDVMNEYMKLAITGIALASLLYLSVRIYKM